MQIFFILRFDELFSLQASAEKARKGATLVSLYFEKNRQNKLYMISYLPLVLLNNIQTDRANSFLKLIFKIILLILKSVYCFKKVKFYKKMA